MRNLIEVVKDARRVSTPLLAISTADQWATMEMLSDAIEATAPKVAWDAARGLRGIGDAGAAAIARLGADANVIKAQSMNPGTALDMATKMPPDTVLFYCNAYRFVNAGLSPVVAQAVSNLRDIFKQDGRTLIMLSPSFDLPAELQQDVVLLDESMPDDESLRKILLGVYESAEQKPQAEDVIIRAVDAARGLSAFSGEQVFAMALRPNGIDLDDAWERKKAAVNQTKGLSITRGGVTFEELGGLASARTFGDRIFRGGKPPRAIIRMDEIEKMLAGAGGSGAGDTSGVSQDALGAILRWMEDEGQDGMILVGPPGAAKTAYSRAIGASHGVPTIDVDLGAMKGSLVGQSEQAVREALRVIKGIAADRAFIVATCNKLDNLPPELKRRFKSGVWFFDLPTAEERQAIWNINLKKYGITDGKKTVELPDDTDWTGAEIRNACDLAFRLSCSLVEAAAYIVPVARQDPDGIKRLRETANGRFLSASYPGSYQLEKAAEGGKRSIKKAGW